MHGRHDSAIAHYALVATQGLLADLCQCCKRELICICCKYSLFHPCLITPFCHTLQCRLPGAGGTWMVVEGGMGVVTQQLATAAMHAGAQIHTASPVHKIEVQDGQATGGQCIADS